ARPVSGSRVATIRRTRSCAGCSIRSKTRAVKVPVIGRAIGSSPTAIDFTQTTVMPRKKATANDRAAMAMFVDFAPVANCLQEITTAIAVAKRPEIQKSELGVTNQKAMPAAKKTAIQGPLSSPWRPRKLSTAVAKLDNWARFRQGGCCIAAGPVSSPKGTGGVRRRAIDVLVRK